MIGQSTHRARTDPRRGARAGVGRAVGVLLGLVAVGGGGYAAWTLWGIAHAPAPKGSGPAGGDGTEGRPKLGMADTETIEGLLASVQQLVRQENFQAAERVLSESVRQYPGDQDLRLAFGDFLMSRQRYAEAYQQYAGAIGLGPVPARVQFTAGTLASQTGGYELAAEHYGAALHADPTVPEYAMYLASVQMKLNRLSEAKASLAIAGRLAPERAEIWGMLAQIALNENKPTIAIEQIAKARAIEPDEPGWILIAARASKRAGDAQGAFDLLAALPQATLDEPGTLELVCECLGMLGRPAEAASRCLDAAEARPDDANLAFSAAQWLERAGERTQAIEWATKAATLGHPRAGEWAVSLVRGQP